MRQISPFYILVWYRFTIKIGGQRHAFDEDFIFSLEPDRVADNFPTNVRRHFDQPRQPVVVREIPIQRLRTTSTTLTKPSIQEKDDKVKLQRKSSSTSEMPLKHSIARATQSNTLPLQIPKGQRSTFNTAPRWDRFKWGLAWTLDYLGSSFSIFDSPNQLEFFKMSFFLSCLYALIMQNFVHLFVLQSWPIHCPIEWPQAPFQEVLVYSQRNEPIPNTTLIFPLLSFTQQNHVFLKISLFSNQKLDVVPKKKQPKARQTLSFHKVQLRFLE